jgi:hypothetical protein
MMVVPGSVTMIDEHWQALVETWRTYEYDRWKERRLIDDLVAAVDLPYCDVVKAIAQYENPGELYSGDGHLAEPGSRVVAGALETCLAEPLMGVTRRLHGFQ